MMIQRVSVSLFALSLLLPLALAPLPASAQLFGPSEEERATVRAHEDGQDAAIEQASQRIRDLEDRVRGLTSSLSRATGANEEMSHQIQQQNQKIDAMQKDFAYRLCTLSAQQLGAGDAMNCAAAGTPSASAVPQQQSFRPGDTLPPLGQSDDFGPAPVLTPPPGTSPPGKLGTLPSGPAPGAPTPLSGPSTSVAPQNASQYDAAMNLMSRAQYDEAAAGFRAYADANPDDTELSPQAIYWVGNISFIRQDYAGAARTFAEGIKKYPKSTRAPDAMFKLAQSFMAMGQKSEGCTTLGLIRTRYPKAGAQTLANAANLRKTACGK
jgi:tol-pal system protein YbgF